MALSCEHPAGVGVGSIEPDPLPPAHPCKLSEASSAAAAAAPSLSNFRREKLGMVVLWQGLRLEALRIYDAGMAKGAARGRTATTVKTKNEGASSG